jgi:hypothetical protein
MIEFFADLYSFILSGVAIGFLVAALFIWYCVYKDMKDKEKFDEKYRQSRTVKDNLWNLRKE